MAGGRSRGRRDSRDGSPVDDPPARHRIHGGVRGLGPRAASVLDPHVRPTRQRGIALLVAIVMFAIATTVASAITYNKAMAARRAAATFALEQALQAGMAAEALAQIALEDDGSNAKTEIHKPWAQ